MYKTDCNKCGLQETKKLHPIPNGTKYKFAVIWDNPDLEEIPKQIPYNTPKGKLVCKVLENLGYNIDDVFLTYACCCTTYNSRKPSVTELACCRERLLNDIKQSGVDKVITLGISPTRILKGSITETIETLRGIPFYSEEFDVWVIPTYDPGYVYHVPSAFTDLVNDFKKLNRKFPFPVITPDITIIDSIGRFNMFAHRNQTVDFYYIDIETNTLNPHQPDAKVISCCLATSPNAAFVITEQLFNDKEFQEIFKKWALSCYFGGHNAIQFDAKFLRVVYGIDIDILEDTILNHYIVDERRVDMHSLDNVARELLGMYNWKAEFQKHLKSKSNDKNFSNADTDKLYVYNALDTCVDYACGIILNDTIREDILLTDNPTLKHIGIISDRTGLSVRLHSISRVLDRMEEVGTKIDKDYLWTVGANFEMESFEICKKLQAFTGLPKFNPNSSKQVGELIYDILELPMVPGQGRTTKKEVLNSLAEIYDNEQLRDIVMYRRLQHLKTTFSDKILTLLSKYPDGRIRTSFLPFGTVTGRLASQDPNLQNIPVHSDEGKKIKKAFVAEKGKILLSGDYSQLEMRVAGWYSNEPNFLIPFSEGADFHRSTAAKIFKKPPEEVTDHERFLAKSTNFGVIYLIGDKKLAQQIKKSPYVTDEEIKTAGKFLDDYYTTNKVFTEWKDSVLEFLREHQFVETPMGRRRNFPLITRNNYLETQREAVNTLVQSLAGDICLDALVRLYTSKPEGVEILLTVHDSILVEAPENDLYAVAEWMKRVMENTGFNAPVDFKVDIEAGYNWAEMEKIII